MKTPEDRATTPALRSSSQDEAAPPRPPIGDGPPSWPLTEAEVRSLKSYEQRLTELKVQLANSYVQAAALQSQVQAAQAESNTCASAIQALQAMAMREVEALSTKYGVPGPALLRAADVH